VTAIWEAVAARRSVTRTTILNLVDRLVKRGWLRRANEQGTYRYLAAVDRAATARLLARGFVNEFFGGSPSELVLSLLGGKRVKPEDVRRLRRLLDTPAPERDSPAEGAP
jgi:predicted transcriptional regulator